MTSDADVGADRLHRILIRLPNWVGDIVMALPAIQSLRSAFPDARLMGMARPEHLELAARIPSLDETVPAAPRTGPDRHRSLWAVTRELRSSNFDAAVVLAPSFEAAMTVWLAGIPIRVGHNTDQRSALLNRLVETRETHRVDGFLDLAAEIGAAPVTEGGRLECTGSDRAYADQLFEQAGFGREARPVFVNPAAAKTPRAWASDRYRQLVDRLAGGSPRVPILVHDHPPFERPGGWPRTEAIRPVSGASLVELAGVMERCSVYVGNDSGPMHIAAALGVPTIGIYGPSSPTRTSPRGRGVRHLAISARFECSPCRERFFEECPSPPTADGRPPCLDAVSVEQVASAVDQLLSPDR